MCLFVFLARDDRLLILTPVPTRLTPRSGSKWLVVKPEKSGALASKDLHDALLAIPPLSLKTTGNNNPLV